ncbi:hypothetical protein DPMN_162255, partial [Dreissena polymorpha]
TSFVDDESLKENPSEYAIPAKKRGKRAKLSLSTGGKKRPATEITEKESGKCERDRTGKKVKWDDNFKNENEFNFDIDSQKAKNAVEKIWALPDGTDYIAGNVHNVNITYNDIRSLDMGEWLTDQVIDGYLAHLTQAAIDKGQIKINLFNYD